MSTENTLREQESMSNSLIAKWTPILEHEDLPEIQGRDRKVAVAMMLENTLNSFESGESRALGLLGEAAPVNSTGSAIDNYDPVIFSLIRRSMPNLIAHDLVGVQPMTGPTGLIFAMRSRYTDQSGTETFYNESDTDFSGTGTQAGTTGTANTANTGTGMATATAEALGDFANNAFPEMAFSIEQITVTAKSRALKAEYTTELAQDLKAIHGLDAETELANILSGELLSEINREIIRTIYNTAKTGAQEDVQTAGTFDLDVDSNGRWMQEKFVGLHFQLEREANKIAKETRRGRGNVILCSSDVASALDAGGKMVYAPSKLDVDDTGRTFAGVLNGKYRVYIDPYSGGNYFVIGYKGSNKFDAGVFYCPYVPLQMARAIGENSFQPKIGFKTRYGMVANPFAQGTTAGNGALTANVNTYYRRVLVNNIL